MKLSRRFFSFTSHSTDRSSTNRGWNSTVQAWNSISNQPVQAWNTISKQVVKEVRIKDESSVYSPVLIFIAIVVSLFCGVAAFLLHLFVGYAGCLGGVNGCHDHILLDIVKPLGIGTSVYFIISCWLSGLICSLILYCGPCSSAASLCKGGGGGHTKILVASGTQASGWVAPLRILLAAIYMGGGNPLGTEGPIIHLSVSLATWLVSKSGKKRRKFLSMFAVIGAAAGISAGFNVLVTGFVYVIEELTRTLSRKLALILAFAAAMAVLFKDYFEKLLHMWIHGPHASLVPSHDTWARLTDSDIEVGLLLCIPIGVLMGFAGWIFTHCAFAMLKFLNPSGDSVRPAWFYWLLPMKGHLAIVGLIIGCLGAIGYEVTGMNGVWGTTVGAIPEAIQKRLGWGDVLLLFILKFAAFILATAASGPGGLLVPSFATGGLLALAVGRCIDVSDDLCAACAVIGMGSMFASVMHMPLTGVIIIFELTRAENLMLHVVIANFIACNIAARLPHGEHSFVHRCLEREATWHKLKERDFIETDDHEKDADLALFVQCVLLTDDDRVKITFERWVTAVHLDKALQTALHDLEIERTDSGRSLRKSRTALLLTIESNSDVLHDCSQILPAIPGGSEHSNSQRSLLRSSTSTSMGSRLRKEDSARRLIRADSARKSTDSDSTAFVRSIDVDDVTDAEGPQTEIRRSVSGRLKFVKGPESESPSPAHQMSPEHVAQRRQMRDQWTLVSEVIPNLNMRVWNAMNYAQRAALCSAIELMRGSKTPHQFPDGGGAPGMFMTPVTTPVAGKLRRPGTDDLVKVMDMGPAPTGESMAATDCEAESTAAESGWKVLDVV